MRARLVALGLVGALVALAVFLWRFVTRGVPALAWAVFSVCLAVLGVCAVAFGLVVLARLAVMVSS